MLHTVVHDLMFPLRPEFAVVSALAGVPTSRVQWLVRKVTRRAIRDAAITNSVLLAVLRSLGFESGTGGDNSLQPLPFNWFLKHHMYLLKHGPMIVRLTSHALVIDKDRFVDHLHLTPAPIPEAAAKWRVKAYQCVKRSAELDT